MTFQCRYKSMGLKECAETPGLYACQPRRELAAFKRQETSAVEAGPLGKLRDMSAEECEKLIGEMSRALSKRTPLQEYIAKIERDILQSTGLPASVLTGTPAASGMYFDGVPLFRNEFMGQLTASGAEERRDDHVDALNYALTGRQSGKTAALDGVLRICGERREDGGAFCTGQVGHDGDHEWAREVRYMPVGWQRIRAAEEKAYRDAGVPLHDYCACGRTMPTTAQHCKKCKPKPPTLREWLGPRVSELGRWAEVLREQPVPAGMIVAWHWDHSGPEWLLIASDRADKPGCGTAVMPDLSGVFDRCDDSTDITCWMESLQMALFHHHPDVKPEPALVRTWFGNEEDV
jgi:hypothetical protein